MEKLNPDRPTYVGPVNMTDDGTTSGKVLPGTWKNFDEVLRAIGSRQIAISGTEFIQLREEAHKPHLLMLSFEDVPAAVHEMLKEINQEHVEVGIMRRYQVYNGLEDVGWKFVSAGPIEVRCSTWRTEIVLFGLFQDIVTFDANL